MISHGGGMIGGAGMGRTDSLPLNVESGSHIIPADVVSGALGAGNSAAGAKILESFFHGPLGMHAPHIHGGFGGPRNVQFGRMKMPAGSSVGSALTRSKSPGFADGGYAHGGMHPAPPGHTPIVAASGEFVVRPHAVLRVGKWNGHPDDIHNALRRGHDVLDKLIIDLREKNRKTLARLPGPVKRAA
jgi:hypothetical protein